MKLKSNTLKIVIAFAVIFGVIFWAVNSVRSRSYSGTNLNFDVAGGLYTVTNPSDDAVSAQLTSSASRTFRVSSTIEGFSGSSTRVEIGSTRIQQFEFELLPGATEFTVSGGTDVRFVAETDTELQASVNPMSSESRLNTILVTTVVVFGALFYASSVTEHQWIRSLRHKASPSRQDTSKQDTQPIPVVVEGGQGRAPHSYGDNRVGH